MSAPFWAWLALSALLAILLAIDLRLNRGSTGPTPRRAVAFSAAWIAVGITFGGLLWILQGPSVAGQYFSAYLLEKSLSVDNIFVFVAVFGSFGVPDALQRRVLFYGVFGALVLRAAFIVSGSVVLDEIGWTFYLFGVVVLVTGLRMAVKSPEADVSDNFLVRVAHKRLPVTATYEGDRFFVSRDGQRFATPLVLVLIAVEVTDLVFATDSIPAAFGVTRDVFVIFAANALAVLGLRALYFVLKSAIPRFRHLRYGLAALLCFVGLKMVLSSVIHVPTWGTLLVIATSVGVSIVLSPQTTPSDRAE